MGGLGWAGRFERPAIGGAAVAGQGQPVALIPVRKPENDPA
jgi:hypothetical protein